MKTKSISISDLSKFFNCRKTFGILFFALLLVSNACNKEDSEFNKTAGKAHLATGYSADVAIDWMNLQANLTKTTPGFDPAMSSRSFAYSGLALYESVLPYIISQKTFGERFKNLSAGALPGAPATAYWPASANAAMANILKSLFPNTSLANFATIDSLENAYKTRFLNTTTQSEIDKAAAFGKKVAASVYEVSKSDGNDKGYLSPFDPTYIIPVGPGKWIPTPPAFLPPVRVHLGDSRSIVLNIAARTQPPPPTPYSEVPGSPFYKMVNDVYEMSLHLTHQDSILAQSWAAIPGNYNESTHFAKVATQLVQAENFTLDKAALTFALHGIALNDAGISVFKTKYRYNLIRPISYIRNVLGHTTWNSVVPTPPHPEYSAAHAVTAAASATVLESIFGTNYAFTDHTHDAKYGSFHYNSLDEYARKAGYSRFVAGIHYMPSIKVGYNQGRKVGLIITGY